MADFEHQYQPECPPQENITFESHSCDTLGKKADGFKLNGFRRDSTDSNDSTHFSGRSKIDLPTEQLVLDHISDFLRHVSKVKASEDALRNANHLGVRLTAELRFTTGRQRQFSKRSRLRCALAKHHSEVSRLTSSFQSATSALSVKSAIVNQLIEAICNNKSQSLPRTLERPVTISSDDSTTATSVKSDAIRAPLIKVRSEEDPKFTNLFARLAMWRGRTVYVSQEMKDCERRKLILSTTDRLAASIALLRELKFNNVHQQKLIENCAKHDKVLQLLYSELSTSNYFENCEEQVGRQEVSCVICMDNINKKSACALPCGHLFHFDCVNRWLMEKPSCPMCKHSVTPIKEH